MSRWGGEDEEAIKTAIQASAQIDRGSKIETLHWARVELWREHPLLAVWPEPLDHDSCFAAAGFDGFADTDAGWDADFAEAVKRVHGVLQVLGSPKLTAGELPVEKQFLRPSKVGTIVDALCAARRTISFSLAR